MVKSLRTEDAVKKALNIESFRHLSKSKVIEFVSMLPQMDREVAIAAINQFPNFSETASGIVNQLKEINSELLIDNRSSMSSVANAYNKILDGLNVVLQQENLSVEERERITSQMVDIADKLAAKDTENKHFLVTIGKCVVVVATVVLLGLAAALGVHIKSSKIPRID